MKTEIVFKKYNWVLKLIFHRNLDLFELVKSIFNPCLICFASF